MFGYKLQLVKKSDLVDVDIFKSSVHKIKEIADDFGEMISNGLNLTQDDCRRLTNFNDDLGLYVDIYFNNKFSLPSNSLSMYKALDEIRKNSKYIIDAICEYNKLQSVEEKFRDRFGDNPSEADPEYYSEINHVASELQRGYQEVNNCLGFSSINILNYLVMITQPIRGDINRIDIGIDFIKDYKRRKKEEKKNKNLDSKFKVEYTLNTRSDKEFLLKERVSNEQRSRTRTSDGGSKETV